MTWSSTATRGVTGPRRPLRGLGAFGSPAFSIPLGLSAGRPLSPFSRAISARWAATVCSRAATLPSNLTTNAFSSVRESASRSPGGAIPPENQRQACQGSENHAAATRFAAVTGQRKSPMPTRCSATGMAFGRAAGRNLVAAFDGGLVTSEAGALLLGATDQAIRLVDRFAACFRDGRHPAFITHQVRSLVGQRIFGLALGYEDLVDHDDLRHDPVLGVLLGRFERDDAAPAPLAGKSTLNRLEHAPADATARYHKIGHDAAAIETVLVDLFLGAFRAKPPREIILDEIILDEIILDEII